MIFGIRWVGQEKKVMKIMGRVAIKEGKLFYHLTHINNLDSIIKNGVLSRSQLQRIGDFSDIADPNIIKKRGELADYIPFHFHQRTAFDYAVIRNQGREKFIYLCVTRKYACDNGFKILPQHPLATQVTRNDLMDYDAGFAAINWELMECEYSDSNEVKQVRMAECLTDKKIPFKDVFSIYYLSSIQKDMVEALLENNGIAPSSLNINDWTNAQW